MNSSIVNLYIIRIQICNQGCMLDCANSQQWIKLIKFCYIFPQASFNNPLFLASPFHTFEFQSCVSWRNGESWRYRGVGGDQHNWCVYILVGFCPAQNSANQRQSLLSQMVHCREEDQSQELGWCGGQICQSKYLDLLYLSELDASGAQDDWVWAYCPCWTRFCCFLEDLYSRVLAISVSLSLSLS